MLNQREEENKQHKQSIQAQNLCYEADYIFFGFKKAEGDTLERAIQLYEESAHLGDSKAMMALGRIYENGLGTKPDFQKAYVYYDLAAAINEPFALYWLGRACEVSFNIFESNDEYRWVSIKSRKSRTYNWLLSFIKRQRNWILRKQFINQASFTRMGQKQRKTYSLQLENMKRMLLM